MANFKEAFEKTMGHEGGYGNDPDDAGGETYKGIARVYNPGWSGWAVIDAAKTASIGNFPASLDQNATLQASVQSFYKESGGCLMHTVVGGFKSLLLSHFLELI